VMQHEHCILDADDRTRQVPNRLDATKNMIRNTS